MSSYNKIQKCCRGLRPLQHDSLFPPSCHSCIRNKITFDQRSLNLIVLYLYQNQTKRGSKMSEVADCPYCGSRVQTTQTMDYDSKFKLRCNNCGGFFEYMPGFGAFSLPEEQQRGPVRYEGSAFRPRYEVYEEDAPWGTERPYYPPESSCGNCCAGLIFCCCILPIIMFIISLVLGFGWFFWFW